MIRFFLYSLLTLIAALTLTLLLASEQGYLLVRVGGYSFETSLYAFVVALFFVFVLLRLVMAILSWFNPVPLLNKSKSWSQRRRERKAAGKLKPSAEEEAQRVIEEIEALSLDSNGLKALQRYWKKQSKRHAGNAAVVRVYVDALVRLQAYAPAVTALEDALAVSWDDALVRRYSLLSLQVDDALAARQLRKAEGWHQERKRDGILLLALGRLSLRNQKWGEARDYFEHSMRVNPDTEVFAELARLLQNLREADRNPAYLQLQTRAVDKVLPAFPQPASEAPSAVPEKTDQQSVA